MWGLRHYERSVGGLRVYVRMCVHGPRRLIQIGVCAMAMRPPVLPVQNASRDQLLEEAREAAPWRRLLVGGLVSANGLQKPLDELHDPRLLAGVELARIFEAQALGVRAGSDANERGYGVRGICGRC